MGRKALLRDIARVNARVDARQVVFAGHRERVGRRISAVHPGWWMGGSFAMGFFAGRQGATASLHYARAGFSLLSVLRSIGIGVSLL